MAKSTYNKIGLFINTLLKKVL